MADFEKNKMIHEEEILETKREEKFAKDRERKKERKKWHGPRLLHMSIITRRL